jgi:hypothetical protein
MNTLLELKSKIKDLAASQIVLKNQRKTVNLEGERTLTPSQAAYKHGQNREELRCLYMAYGILRGKQPEEMESNPKTPINQKLVDKLVEQYKPISDETVCAN